MTTVTRQAMSDDSGTFTDGTEVDKAFVDQVYDQIDDQVHSSTNPTIKPKATTDEVVAARGSKATLDARLDVSLEEDGTLKTQAGLISAAQYQAALGSRNVALNGDLDDWSSGGAAAPDDWTLTTVTIARTGVAMVDTFQFGTGLNGFAAKLTRAGADGSLKQVVISAANIANFANVKGQKFGASMKAKTSLANACRLVIDDGVTTTASSFHTGGNTEEHLSALHTISLSATKLEVYVEITGGNGDSYVGGFNFTFASLAPADWQPLSKEAPASTTRQGLVTTGTQSFAGNKTFTGNVDVQGDLTFDIGAGTEEGYPSSVLHVDVTTVGNVGGGEDDLMSYTMPANTLSRNGMGIRITARGVIAGADANRTVRLKIGGTTISFNAAMDNAVSTGYTKWWIDATIIRVGAASQVYVEAGGQSFAGTWATGNDPGHKLNGTLTFDETAACIIKVTGESAGAVNNDITQTLFLIEALN